MKIDIYNLVSTTRHCSYCNHRNNDQFFCSRCMGTNDYYGKPLEFETDDILASDYFTLLSEYTKLLNKLGFTFK